MKSRVGKTNYLFFIPSLTFYRVSNSLVRSANAFLLILSFAFHFIWQRNVLAPSFFPSHFVGACALTRTVCIFQIHSLRYLCICKSESAVCLFVFVSVCVSNKFSNSAINSRFLHTHTGRERERERGRESESARYHAIDMENSILSCEISLALALPQHLSVN